MLKHIGELQKKSSDFRRKFLTNCRIYEKFDAHRVSVEIISEDHIKFRKTGNREIRQEDLILYPHWAQFILDFTSFFYINRDWAKAHKGAVIRMYFFPSKQPGRVVYNHDYRYIIDSVVLAGGFGMPNDTLEHLSFPPELEGKMSHIPEIQGDLSFPVETKNLVGLLSDSPAGLVFTSGKTSYQLPLNVPDTQQEKQNPIYFELLLCSFVDWAKKYDWKRLVTNNYVKTACMLYNAYMKSKQGSQFCNSVKPEDIEIKHINGMVPDINLSYVPSLKTRELCEESRINKAVFKVLLANLGHKHKAPDFKYVPPGKATYLNDMVRMINLHKI